MSPEAWRVQGRGHVSEVAVWGQWCPQAIRWADCEASRPCPSPQVDVHRSWFSPEKPIPVVFLDDCVFLVGASIFQGLMSDFGI